MTGSAVLVFGRGDAQQERALLSPVIAIGRAADNQVVLDDAQVSRHHARINVTDDGFTITDVGSGNGTHLNGVELEPRVPQPLQPGDTVLIGNHTFTLRAAPDAEDTVLDTASVALDPSATFVMVAGSRLLVSSAGGDLDVRLDKERYSIGRDGASDIVIDDRAVSRRHADLTRLNGTYEIVDLGSANGLALNGERIERRRLAEGDTLTIAESVTLIYRTTYGQSETWLPLQRFNLDERQAVTIGRLAENDIPVEHPAVSRFHARITRLDARGAFSIEDLDSTNGTFVNGAAVAAGKRRPLASGDTIRVGPVKFLFTPETLERVDESRELRLDALHLNQPVSSGVNLLQDISLSVFPQEFVAVVGISGAGKSTLLGALNGFRPAREGAVLINGDNLYRNFDAHRTNLGYVPQDDIIHMELTVQRALDYAAQLRLPGDTSAAERVQRVTEVLQGLGLQERRDVPVRILSGGQRKRVSMGVELLTKPSLFFLDEATSGLDPGTELQMMRLLRRLADDGHTILLITHATKNVAFCDQVVFLARGGHLAWYGPPDAALAYFDVTDFDAIYEKLEEELTSAEWAARYRASVQYQTYVSGRLQERYGPDFASIAAGTTATAPAAIDAAPLPAGGAGRAAQVSNLRQFRVLSARYIDIIRRDRTGLILLFAVAPILGAIDLIAWPRDILSPATGIADRTMTMLFLATINPFLVGGLSSVREIVKEAAIYKRERMVTLKVLPYLLSKVWVAFLFSLYNAAAFLAFKLIAIDMSTAGTVGIAALYGTFVLASLSGAMWGLVLSAWARREEQVMMLIVLVVVVQIVFSGGILPLKNLGPAGTVLGSITSSKWVFQAEATALKVKSGNCTGSDFSDCSLPGIGKLATNAEKRVLVNQIDERFGDVFGQRIAVCWGALIAISLAMFAILYVLQKRKDAT